MKITNIKSQIVVFKLRLLTAKTYPNFARNDQFLRDLEPKYRLVYIKHFYLVGMKFAVDIQNYD